MCQHINHKNNNFIILDKKMIKISVNFKMMVAKALMKIVKIVNIIYQVKFEMSKSNQKNSKENDSIYDIRFRNA